MGSDGDLPVSLPSPPPPNPAARREAIETALRKFDGIEEAPARRKTSSGRWATMHRRPAGALVAAALIAVVLIPAVPIILQDKPPAEGEDADVRSRVQPTEQASACEGPGCVGSVTSEQGSIQSDEALVTTASPLPLAPPAIVAEERRELASAENDQLAAREAPALVVAAPAPSLPPPPPPPPSEPDVAGAQNIVVTGSLIPAPNKAKQDLADEVGYAAKSASSESVIDPYGEFLSRLQAGLRANDRRAVSRLVALPLRVSANGSVRIYRSSRDIERDFDKIFTASVRQAALNLHPDTLMVRDGGRLRGKDPIWFGCDKSSCPSSGAIRVREVIP